MSSNELSSDDIRDNLGLVADEIDLLWSMYPDSVFIECEKDMDFFVGGKGERSIREEDLQRFGERPIKYYVEISLSLKDDESGGVEQLLVGLDVEVSSRYPSHEVPRVHLRSQDMGRRQLSRLNLSLKEALSEICVPGELSVCSCLQWINDRKEEILSQFVAERETREASTKPPSRPTLMRYWLVSHHIYRKELIQKIKSLSDELNLDGFFMCGKPGVICIEGLEANCVEYWSRLRRNGGNVWKHINCKHTETITDESAKLFESFSEVSFKAHGTYGLRNDFHMNMGDFRRYLETAGCDPEIFKILFGIEQ